MDETNNNDSSLQCNTLITVGDMAELIYRKDAAKFLGVTTQTVWNYEKSGTLTPIKNQVNGRVYYTKGNVMAVLGSKLNQTKQAVLYCRAAVLGSTGNNNPVAPRLAKQIERMSDYCMHTGIRVDKVISDMGKGVGNQELPGLSRLIEMVLRKQVSLLVVETPDRLARWGMGMILENFLKWHGVELHVASPVLNRPEYVEEIKNDLAEVIFESRKLLGETT